MEANVPGVRQCAVKIESRNNIVFLKILLEFLTISGKKWDNVVKDDKPNRFSKTRISQKAARFTSDRASEFAKSRRQQCRLANPRQFPRRFKHIYFRGTTWSSAAFKKKNKPTWITRPFKSSYMANWWVLSIHYWSLQPCNKKLDSSGVK